MLFNLKDGVSYHLMRRVRVITLKRFLSGETLAVAAAAAAVTAVESGGWQVLTTL